MALKTRGGYETNNSWASSASFRVYNAAVMVGDVVMSVVTVGDAAVRLR